MLLAALLAVAPPATHAPACLPITAQQDAPVTLSGRLERHVYPGPPNYGESPHDSREPALILVLDRTIRIAGGGETGIACTPFRRAHIITTHDRLWPRLHAAIGHRIRVSGDGFGAISAHHRAPLVVDVTRVQRISR